MSGANVNGERCPVCHGNRGKIIARVRVLKRTADMAGKPVVYEYLRFTHRRKLKDGTTKRLYCYERL